MSRARFQEAVERKCVRLIIDNGRGRSMSESLAELVSTITKAVVAV
jgi:hypothetical protein